MSIIDLNETVDGMLTMLRRRIGEDINLAWRPGKNLQSVVVPEMNGRNLAKNLLSLYPKLKCLFMSGYTANVVAHQEVLDEGVDFIQKPFSINDLAAKIRDIFPVKVDL